MTLLDRFVIVGHSTNVNPWHVCTHSVSAYLVNLYARYFDPLKIVNKVNTNAIDQFSEVSSLDIVREKLKSSLCL